MSHRQKNEACTGPDRSLGRIVCKSIEWYRFLSLVFPLGQSGQELSEMFPTTSFITQGEKKIACVLDACFREEHFLLPCNSRWMRCYLCNVHLLYVPLLFSNIKAQKKQGLMERILYFSRVTKVMDPSGQTWLKDKSGSTNRTRVGSW